MSGYVEVEIPGMGIVEFPDTMSDQEISAAIRKTLKPKKPESLKEKVMRYGVKGPAAGTAKLLRNIGDVPPGIGNYISEKLGSNFRMPHSGITDEEIYKAFGLPPANEQNMGDVASQILPDIAGAIAAPELQIGRLAPYLAKAPGLLGKILPKAASQAATQATYGGAVSPEGHKLQGVAMSGLLAAPFAAAGRAAAVTPSVPLRHALGVGIGTGGGYLGYEAGQHMGLPPYASALFGGLLGAAGYRGTASPQAKMAAQIQGMDLTDPNVIERLQAAERLGVNITPAEAAESPFLAREHAKLGGSEEGSRKYYEKLEERIGQEKESINKLLETTYDPSTMDAKVTEGYERLYPQKVPPTIPFKYSNNKTVEKITRNIEKDPELMAAAEKSGITMGEGSSQRLDKSKLGYWDLIKRYLDKEVSRISSPDAPSVDKLKKDTFDKLRKGIINDLDNVKGANDLPLFPEYKEVRSLSERNMASRTIQKAFDKYNVGGHRFSKAFESDEKFNELMAHLRDVPQAQQMMKDMRLIFKESPKAPSLRGVAGKEGTGMYQKRNFGDYAEAFIEKLQGGEKYNPEAIDFIMSGKWHERMKEINKITDDQLKWAKRLELLSEMAAPIERRAGENND